MSLDENLWSTLVDSIVAKECTPFLGAGVAMPDLPSGKELANTLAARFDYPLLDTDNLARVSQFVASTHQPVFAKRQVAATIQSRVDTAAARLGGAAPVNYCRLADLDLPVWITTNYDDFLERALVAAARTPVRQVCRWNDLLCRMLPPYGEVEPTPQSPLVFYLHGRLADVRSILVTEDDYIDFTVSLALRETTDPVIPFPVREALSWTNLLFIGYSLEDWNFRVLMRHLMKQQKVVRDGERFNLSVQLSARGVDPRRRADAEQFLADYFGASQVRVHWGPAEPFLAELHRRVREAVPEGGA